MPYETLLEARKRAGNTLQDMADKLGCSRPTYAAIEADPSRATVLQAKTICSLLSKNYDNSAPGGNVYNTVCFEIPGAIKALQVTVDAQTAAIKALAESQGADPDSIAKTVSDAVAKKLESIDLSVTVGD